MPSFVWQHFEKTADGKRTTCLHCRDSLLYKTGSTSAMKSHLAAKHSIEDPQNRKRIAEVSAEDGLECNQAPL